MFETRDVYRCLSKFYFIDSVTVIIFNINETHASGRFVEDMRHYPDIILQHISLENRMYLNTVTVSMFNKMSNAPGRVYK